MAETIGSRFKNALNAFLNKDPTYYHDLGYRQSSKPDRLSGGAGGYGYGPQSY